MADCAIAAALAANSKPQEPFEHYYKGPVSGSAQWLQSLFPNANPVIEAMVREKPQ